MSTEISIIPKTPSEVAKSIVYVALAVGALLINSGSGAFTLTLGLSIAILVLGLVPVYFLSGTAVKAGVAFGLAALNALNVIFIGGVAGFGGVTRNEWITIGIQAFAAIGIIFIPNRAPAAVTTISVNGTIK